MINKSVISFFDGIENDIAFSFFLNEDFSLSPAGNPKYHLFEGDIYPFVVYSDELKNINTYCYEVSQLVKTQYYSVLDKFNKAKSNDVFKHYTLGNIELTSDDEYATLEEDLYSWENILEHNAYHLCILIYSFLERTLHKISDDLQCQKESKPQITNQNKNKIPKAYEHLTKILKVNLDQFKTDHIDIYFIIDKVRKVRNSIVHGTDTTIVFDFSLIEVIDCVSSILDIVQEAYIKNQNIDISKL